MGQPIYNLPSNTQIPTEVFSVPPKYPYYMPQYPLPAPQVVQYPQ